MPQNLHINLVQFPSSSSTGLVLQYFEKSLFRIPVRVVDETTSGDGEDKQTIRLPDKGLYFAFTWPTYEISTLTYPSELLFQQDRNIIFYNLARNIAEIQIVMYDL